MTWENRVQVGMLPKRGRRHGLLYQHRLHQIVFWPGLVIVLLSAALFLWGARESRVAVAVVLLGSTAALLLTLLFKLRAYTQCRRSGLRVQLPFLHLEIPYGSIRTTRPTDLYRVFPPSRLRWTQRSFLRLLFGCTVIVVELAELPAPRPWLRRWMGPYMLSPDTPGLVLLVRDWMALHRELHEYRARSLRTGLLAR